MGGAKVERGGCRHQLKLSCTKRIGRRVIVQMLRDQAGDCQGERSPGGSRRQRGTPGKIGPSASFYLEGARIQKKIVGHSRGGGLEGGGGKEGHVGEGGTLLRGTSGIPKGKLLAAKREEKGDDGLQPLGERMEESGEASYIGAWGKERSSNCARRRSKGDSAK